MAVRLKWEGDRIFGEIENNLNRRTRRASEYLLSVAQEECPVRTGRLRNSGHIESVGRRNSNRVVFDAPYAGFVEFGTRRSRANPFFRRAIARTQDDIRSILAGSGEKFAQRLFGSIRVGIGRIFGLGG